MKKILIIAIVVTSIVLLALLVYSLERTSWLFGLFETWQPAAYAAAIVVELAAVALLVGAGALAHLDLRARAWANRALLAVLSVASLANLSAGYLRGGRSTLAEFTGDARAAYAVAAALWFVTNLAVPGLILCLSKLLERLIAALIAVESTDAVAAVQPDSTPAYPESTVIAVTSHDESAPPSKRQQVARLATEMNRSESTIWRQVKAGKITLIANGRE